MGYPGTRGPVRGGGESPPSFCWYPGAKGYPLSHQWDQSQCSLHCYTISSSFWGLRPQPPCGQVVNSNSINQLGSWHSWQVMVVPRACYTLARDSGKVRKLPKLCQLAFLIPNSSSKHWYPAGTADRPPPPPRPGAQSCSSNCHYRGISCSSIYYEESNQ